MSKKPSPAGSERGGRQPRSVPIFRVYPSRVPGHRNGRLRVHPIDRILLGGPIYDLGGVIVVEYACAGDADGLAKSLFASLQFLFRLPAIRHFEAQHENALRHRHDTHLEPAGGTIGEGDCLSNC